MAEFVGEVAVGIVGSVSALRISGRETRAERGGEIMSVPDRAGAPGLDPEAAASLSREFVFVLGTPSG
jgi:hypothetical protein